MSPSDPNFAKAFLADMHKIQETGHVFLVKLDAATLVSVVGHLQLALRHPQNRGASARQIAGVIDQLINLGGVTETIRLGMKAGNDPRYDTATPPVRGTAVVRPTVVCLCGSTRFWRTFQEASLKETLCGRIILSIGAARGRDNDDRTFGGYTPADKYDSVKTALDELHLRKIDMADEILVLDVAAPHCLACRKPCETTFHPVGATGYNWSSCCNAGVTSLPYIGESTSREIAYAEGQGKRVRYWSQEDRT